MARAPTEPAGVEAAPPGTLAEDDSVPLLDERLLGGFSFACRPDCGLCCFASPRITNDDRRALLAIAPAAEIVARGRDRFLAARPEGGACQFLQANRCGVHGGRPTPCRQFPIHVHVGERLQATLVLSCPGLDLRGLAVPPAERRHRPAIGLDDELGAVRGQIQGETEERLVQARRRRRRIVRRLESQGRWIPESEVRVALDSRIPLPSPRQFEVEDPPSAEDGLEQLPLFFDGRPAPVAIARSLGGWEILELRSEGGVERALGVYPPPDRPPVLSAEGERRLTDYLRYWLERDALFGTVLFEMVESDEGTALEWVESELLRIGAITVARASVRARLRGEDGRRLAEDDIDRGIRATDQDLLDRPTWGDRL